MTVPGSFGVVTAFAVAATDDLPIVAASTTGGLLWSDDGGRSWRLADGAPPVAFEVVALSPCFRGDRTVYVITGGALLCSNDGGVIWRPSLAGSDMMTVAATKDGDGLPVVFAGTGNDGVFRSSDGGDNWESANPGLTDLTVLATATSPAFAVDKTCFLGTASGLYRSRNGGHAWRSLDLPLADPAVQALAISPGYAGDGTVLAGTEADGLLLSRNGGRIWEVVEPLVGQSVTAVACASGSRLAAATSEGIAVSDDAGATWQMTGEELGAVLCLAFVSGDGGEILLTGPVSGGLRCTADGGRIWHLGQGNDR